MASNARFAEIAALAGDPARAAMLHALMDGRALTAGELAAAGGITPQTASGHLARLAEAGLIGVVKQGRHRYHRLASPAVAQMMESIMRIASATEPAQRPRTGPRDAALRAARTCYNHLAGRLGVAIADALVEDGHAELTDEAGLITDSGLALFDRIGLDTGTLASRDRRAAGLLCRPCLDWSERRPHLAGALGTALCRHSFESGWIRRIEGTRAVAVTRKGEQAFRNELGVRLEG